MSTFIWGETQNEATPSTVWITTCGSDVFIGGNLRSILCISNRVSHFWEHMLGDPIHHSGAIPKAATDAVPSDSSTDTSLPEALHSLEESFAFK